MYKLTLRVRHDHCWASEISTAFPQYQLYLRNTVPIDKRSMDILHIRSPRTDDFDGIIPFLEEHSTIERVEVLDRTSLTLTLLVSGRSEQSIIRTISDANAFILKPVHLTVGEEVWTIGLAQRDAAKEIVDNLMTVGKVDVSSLTRDEFQTLKLTKSQRSAIDLANAMGYYEFPRKASPAEVAKKLGVSKSTLLEHLHKAESRVIAAYLESN